MAELPFAVSLQVFLYYFVSVNSVGDYHLKRNQTKRGSSPACVAQGTFLLIFLVTLQFFAQLLFLVLDMPKAQAASNNILCPFLLLEALFDFPLCFFYYRINFLLHISFVAYISFVFYLFCHILLHETMWARRLSYKSAASSEVTLDDNIALHELVFGLLTLN